MTTHPMPDSPQEHWWRALPEDFHSHHHQVEVQAHQLQVRAAAAIDLGLRTVLSTVVSGGLAALMLSPERMEKENRRLAFYRDILDRGNIDEIFPMPPEDVDVEQTSAPLLGYRPRNIPNRLLSFDTPFQALNPAMRKDYRRFHDNNRAMAQHWKHPSGPRPTLIFTHGFMADAYWINAELFALRWFYRKGYDILLYTLPFHGRRRHRASLVSGLGYVMNGLCHFNEAVLQSVYDLRILIGCLKRSGVPCIGLSGLSLGGYISALTAEVDDRISFCVPNTPAVSPPDMGLEWWPSGPVMRRLMARTGMDLHELRHSVALHSPLSWKPRLEPDRLLIIAGAADRFVAPKYIRLLHEHWKGSELHWFPGNHLMHFRQREYLKLMLRFMNRCCNVEVPPEARGGGGPAPAAATP